MVDVSAKPVTVREAVARGRVTIAPTAMRLVRAGELKKGGVIEVARLAGIMAAKRTSDTIPLCHPLPLAHVDVELRPRRDGFVIEARVRSDARTGAEMEALHAVAVAALTVYDMVKAADKTMTIGDPPVCKTAAAAATTEGGGFAAAVLAPRRRSATDNPSPGSGPRDEERPRDPDGPRLCSRC
jgi:cyclic pyranopterin phosphate synthase